VIVGSTGEGRFAPTVADWFVRAAGEYGCAALDVIDLADVPLPVVVPGFGTDA
jgi:NAD(P)H-dependent FMN reductase